MKVNLKNTRIFLCLSLLCLLVYILPIPDVLSQSAKVAWGLYWRNGILLVLNLAISIYVINVLNQVGESKQLIIVYTLNTLFQLFTVALSTIMRLYVSRIFLYSALFRPIEFLGTLLIIYLAILLLNIKHPDLKLGFRIYGLTLFPMIIFEIIFPYLPYYIFSNRSIMQYLSLVSILPSLAIVFVLIRVLAYAEDDEKAKTVLNIDEN